MFTLFMYFALIMHYHSSAVRGPIQGIPAPQGVHYQHPNPPRSAMNGWHS